MLYLYEHTYLHNAQTLQSNQLLGERVKALRPASFLNPSNSRGLKKDYINLPKFPSIQPVQKLGDRTNQNTQKSGQPKSLNHTMTTIAKKRAGNKDVAYTLFP